MAIQTRLEVPFFNVTKAPIMRVKIPHTAPAWVDVELPESAYPTHYHLARAIEQAVEDATGSGPTVPGTSGDFYVEQDYSTGFFHFKSDSYTPSYDFSDAESTYGITHVRDYMGFTSQTYTADADVPSDETPKSSFTCDTPVFREAYDLRLNRTANFADDGRVKGILLNRYLGYSCQMRWSLAEHDAWVAFARWLVEYKTVCLWSRWDTVDADANNYACRPWPQTWGYKLLYLNMGGGITVDNPWTQPSVVIHSTDISGVLYGI
jgi:hypothetical protein